MCLQYGFLVVAIVIVIGIIIVRIYQRLMINSTLFAWFCVIMVFKAIKS